MASGSGSEDGALAVIHLRAETKPLERRSPLSPRGAKTLIESGYDVRVEESADRIYKTEEYAAVGAEIVPAGSWVDAPKDHIIMGLKELPDDTGPLSHTHIHFAHNFKKQEGWVESLSRFAKGGGLLYDLEFLVDDTGRRISAFGYFAGYAGVAIALLAWSHQILHPGTPQGPVPVFDSAEELTAHVKSALEPAVQANGGALPTAIVIGALGRCGKGAVDFFEAAGIDSVLKWDLPETSKGGPFEEIAQSDIFVNCVYLGAHRVPPFTTAESLSAPGRKLRVIADISCDPNSENNPIPIYSSYSSFTNPTIPPSKPIDGPEIGIVAIDHLPTLVARESSDEFSQLLLPHLVLLAFRDDEDDDSVWQRAEKTYREKVKELPA